MSSKNAETNQLTLTEYQAVCLIQCLEDIISESAFIGDPHEGTKKYLDTLGSLKATIKTFKWPEVIN